MPELSVCYDIIFKEFPVMLLRGWQYFEWDHDGDHSNPGIETLRDFQIRYDEVIRIFEKNNFVKEYDDRFKGTDLWHEHPSFEACKEKLWKLKTAIETRGHIMLAKDITQIFSKYRNLDLNTLGGFQIIDPVDRDVLALIESYSQSDGTAQEFWEARRAHDVIAHQTWPALMGGGLHFPITQMYSKKSRRVLCCIVAYEAVHKLPWGIGRKNSECVVVWPDKHGDVYWRRDMTFQQTLGRVAFSASGVQNDSVWEQLWAYHGPLVEPVAEDAVVDRGTVGRDMRGLLQTLGAI